MSTPTRDALLQRYRNIGTDHPVEVVAAPTVTPVHREVVALLDELLGFVPAEAGPFSGLTRMLKRLEPALLRDFAKVPPDQVVVFLHELGRRMLAVGGAPANADAGAALAGERESQSA